MRDGLVRIWQAQDGSQAGRVKLDLGQTVAEGPAADEGPYDKRSSSREHTCLAAAKPDLPLNLYHTGPHQMSGQTGAYTANSQSQLSQTHISPARS